MKDLFSEYKGEPLYIQLYMYYRDRIIDGSLSHGEKLPSIRKCSTEFGISKMTVESAYMQLAAEGYVYPKSQSGFFVAEISDLTRSESVADVEDEKETTVPIKFDFSGSSVDIECFDFKLWQKYVKNALRCEERLLSYGEPQGEYDLREALSEYATRQRGVICTPSQIVIGASVQNLIQLLCSLNKGAGTVVFEGESFLQGRAVFEDYGFDIINGKENYSGDNVDFIYVSPSHYGEHSAVMNISERVELLNFARKHNSIIIEDDFDSEFCYFSRPVSSMQGLDGGERVAYIGTMSKLLLPSIRISFMVLPKRLAYAYRKKGSIYNQTASKAEQIALARYIKDQRLVTQIRKSKKLYEHKTELMKSAIERELHPERIFVSESGFVVFFDIPDKENVVLLKEKFRRNGVVVKSLEQLSQNFVRMFVSSASIPKDSIENSVKMLKMLLKY